MGYLTERSFQHKDNLRAIGLKVWNYFLKGYF